jgi:hypothetical protein
MGEQGGPERLTARDRAYAFSADVMPYIQKHIGLTFRSCDTDVTAFVTRKYHQTELGPLPIDSPAVEVVVKIHYDGDEHIEMFGFTRHASLRESHAFDIGLIARMHGAAIKPVSLVPAKPAEGEPVTVIFTFHFTESE